MLLLIFLICFLFAYSSALSRPVVLPVPEIAAAAVFGEMGKEMLLGGQKARPAKLLKAGFKFQDEDLVQAIKSEASR